MDNDYQLLRSKYFKSKMYWTDKFWYINSKLGHVIKIIILYICLESWITSNSLHCVKYLDKLKQVWSRNPENLIAGEHFIDYRKILTKVIRRKRNITNEN